MLKQMTFHCPYYWYHFNRGIIIDANRIAELLAWLHLGFAITSMFIVVTFVLCLIYSIADLNCLSRVIVKIFYLFFKPFN